MQLVSCLVGPKDNDFGDFDWVEETSHKPERLAVGKWFLDFSYQFCVGNVEAKARLVRLTVLDVNVVFGYLHVDQA